MCRGAASWVQGIHAAAARGLAEGLPAYKLPQQPEFLFSEEAAVHRRSWSENLTFYTGSGYLSGVATERCRCISWLPLVSGKKLLSAQCADMC